MLTSRLSLTDRELLCTLNADELPESFSWIPLLNLELAEIYENGNAEVCPDKVKAKQFRNNFIDHSTSFFENFFTTKKFYDLLSEVSSLRLLLVRINRFAKYIRYDFLPGWFTYLGLSYALELIGDGIEILAYLFNKDQLEISFWQRLLNVIYQEGRISRVVNALVWLAVNTASLFVSQGMFCILNLGGFSFDVVHESEKCYNTIKNYEHLIKNVDDEIVDLKTQFQNTEEENQRTILKQNIEDHQVLKKSIIKARNKQVAKHAWTIFTCTVLLVGMALFFFPPAHPLSIGLIGAGLALGAGSIIGGFGLKMMTRLYHDIKGCVKSKKEIKPSEPPKVTNSLKEHCSVLLKQDNSLQSQSFSKAVERVNSPNQTPSLAQNSPSLKRNPSLLFSNNLEEVSEDTKSNAPSRALSPSFT